MESIFRVRRNDDENHLNREDENYCNIPELTVGWNDDKNDLKQEDELHWNECELIVRWTDENHLETYDDDHVNESVLFSMNWRKWPKTKKEKSLVLSG